MPNNYDFSKLDNIKTIEINPKGWINPLFIEYGINYHGEVLSYFWKIKGTQHTFIIPILRIDYLTQGDYKKHFEEILEGFREDYIEWQNENFHTDWMKKYYNQFNNLII